jgi:hypothetical protein
MLFVKDYLLLLLPSERGKSYHESYLVPIILPQKPSVAKPFARVRFKAQARLSAHEKETKKRPLLTSGTATFARRFCSEVFSLPRIG